MAGRALVSMLAEKCRQHSSNLIPILVTVLPALPGRAREDLER